MTFLESQLFFFSDQTNVPGHWSTTRISHCFLLSLVGCQTGSHWEVHWSVVCTLQMQCWAGRIGCWWVSPSAKDTVDHTRRIKLSSNQVEATSRGYRLAWTRPHPCNECRRLYIRRGPSGGSRASNLTCQCEQCGVGFDCSWHRGEYETWHCWVCPTCLSAASWTSYQLRYVLFAKQLAIVESVHWCRTQAGDTWTCETLHCLLWQWSNVQKRYKIDHNNKSINDCRFNDWSYQWVEQIKFQLSHHQFCQVKTRPAFDRSPGWLFEWFQQLSCKFVVYSKIKSRIKSIKKCVYVLTRLDHSNICT